METEETQAIEEAVTNMFGELGYCPLRHIGLLSLERQLFNGEMD